MNYWSAEMTNLELMTSLFDYINVGFSFIPGVQDLMMLKKTWAPRGAYTAQVLYNMSQGWVTHDEVSCSCLVWNTLVDDPLDECELLL